MKLPDLLPVTDTVCVDVIIDEPELVCVKLLVLEALALPLSVVVGVPDNDAVTDPVIGGEAVKDPVLEGVSVDEREGVKVAVLVTEGVAVSAAVPELLTVIVVVCVPVCDTVLEDVCDGERVALAELLAVPLGVLLPLPVCVCEIVLDAVAVWVTVCDEELLAEPVEELEGLFEAVSVEESEAPRLGVCEAEGTNVPLAVSVALWDDVGEFVALAV